MSWLCCWGRRARRWDSPSRCNEAETLQALEDELCGAAAAAAVSTKGKQKHQFEVSPDADHSVVLRCLSQISSHRHSSGVLVCPGPLNSAPKLRLNPLFKDFLLFGGWNIFHQSSWVCCRVFVLSRGRRMEEKHLYVFSFWLTFTESSKESLACCLQTVTDKPCIMSMV